MRCLYCGKELALLKRLRGGGEFCSDAHRQSYQEEYNRLALSRLLQAQKKPEKPDKAALAEKPEKPAKSNKEQAPAPQAPVLQQPEAQAPEAPVPQIAASEAQPVPEAVPEPEREKPQPAAAHPLEDMEPGGFLVEFPCVPAVAEILDGVTPQAAQYLEANPEEQPAPALVSCDVDPQVYDLSTSELVPLPALTNSASTAEATVRNTLAAPGEFEATKPAASVSWKVVSRRVLPSAAATPLELPALGLKFEADRDFAQPVNFNRVIQIENRPRWELPVTSADLPAEEADVVVGPWSGNGDHELWMDTAPMEAANAALEEFSTEPEATPRLALEALSRLHQELAHAGTTEAGGGATTVAPVATLVEEPPQEELREEELREEELRGIELREEEFKETPQVVSTTVIEVEATVVDAASPASGPAPGHVTELLELAIKTHGPGKPSPMPSEPLAIRPAALLPRLKTLPLRPKIALAPEYARQQPDSKPAAEPEAKPTAAAPRALAQSKAASSKPSPVPLRGVQPKHAASPIRVPAPHAPVESAKPAAAAKVETPVPAAKSGERPAAPPPAAKAAEALPSKPEVAPKEDETKKPAAKAASASPATPPPTKEDSAPKPLGQDEVLPSFGSIQASPSFLGSLKLKLGIGIVLIVGVCTAYLGWGSKPHKPAPASDGAGPSIIMGEGGWVEGWGGDPSNVHAGRQITIYRPSLTMADYRIEFQGMIETKSLGWVFRAADPENYYAMKLTEVSGGVTPKIELFKYLVANGRQTQVGRVPIDLPARPDTYFSVRVDARGPQFTTYIQGQQVDVWTDDQLKTGGVGLLNERDERGQVKAVSIRILNGAGK